MLASLLARHAWSAARDVDQFAAWAGTMRRLREEWAAGARPTADDLPRRLEGLPAAHVRAARDDLITAHLGLTWQIGPGTRLEDYGATLGVDVALPPADLVVDEFLARHQSPHGDRPAVDEYARRFPGRADVMEMLRARTLANGRYGLLFRCGIGAMGEVWEACDRHALAPVAIKRPRPDAPDAIDVARRFADEARITADLDHPGIVTMRPVVPHDGPPAYVMRLVRGPTLAERIRELHAPSATRTRAQFRAQRHALVGALRAVADAVAHAHRHHVLHRDLTPANIIDEQPGRPVILDWGLARRPGAEGTVRDATAGTPEYMAPEQADGRADVRSDVFSLGAILYEILAGRTPHGWPDGARPVAWRDEVRRAAFVPPRHAHRRVPPVLSALALQALARDPAQRPASARGFGAALERWLRDDDARTRAPWWRWF